MINIQASSIYRIVKCPGSVELAEAQEKFPEEKKAIAEFGIACHKAAEVYLFDNLHAANLSRKVEQTLKKYNIDKSHPDHEKALNAVTTYAKHVQKTLKTMKTEYDLYIERKFEIIERPHRYVAKADLAFVTKKEAHIFDLKTGSFDYSESGIMQLQFTAWMLKVLEKIKDQKIYLHIIQPNFYDEQKRIMIKEYTDFELPNLKEPVFNSGPHCTFCPTILSCPYTNQTTDIIEKDKFNPEKITIEKLISIYEKKSLIENYLKRVEEILLINLKQGKQIKGLYLKQTSGHRRWINETQIEKKFKKKLGEDLYTKKLKSPAQLEKILGKEAVEDLTEKPELYRIGFTEHQESPFETEV